MAYKISGQTRIPAFIVGGAVRDSLIGFIKSSDCDFVIGDGFDTFVQRYADEVQGAMIPWDFGQVRIVFKEHETYYSADFSKLKGDSITSDMSKRDFTINALAVELHALFNDTQAQIIDPLNGRQDTSDKVIKICSPAAIDNDPLRILRAIRFARELTFSIDTNTLQHMREKAHMLHRAARERIKREFFTILGLPDVALSLKQLTDCGILQRLLPELNYFADVAQSTPHEHNLLEHSLRTVEVLDGLPETCDFHVPNDVVPDQYLHEIIEEGVTRRSLLMFAGLLHDSGKTVTGKETDGKIIFHGHECEGVRLNRIAAQRLGLGKRAQRIVETITAQHMRIVQLSLLPVPTERAKIRLIRDIDDVFWEILSLALADMTATGTGEKHLLTVERVKALEHDLIDIKYAPAFEQHNMPLLTGRDIMDILHTSEGPEVGILLRELHEKEINGCLSTRDEAVQWLQKKKRQYSKS